MLVLSRKSGESLMIGEDIVITVLDSAQSQVRIGISAPRDIPVHREEIYLRVLSEKMEAKTERINPPPSRHAHQKPILRLNAVESKA